MHAVRGGALGNGRAVRNILEKAKRRQAVRLQNTPGKKGKDDLCQLTAADFLEQDLETLLVGRKSAPGATTGRGGQGDYPPMESAPA
jgi:hypothetical protein